jgi:hypothetical protein
MDGNKLGSNTGSEDGVIKRADGSQDGSPVDGTMDGEAVGGFVSWGTGVPVPRTKQYLPLKTRPSS